MTNAATPVAVAVVGAGERVDQEPSRVAGLDRLLGDAHVSECWRRGVLEREKAEIGVLLSFEEPTAGMRAEAAEAGFHTSPWGKHPRIQLRTIGELLDGRGVDYPHVTGSNVTHKRAARARDEATPTIGMFEEG